jgi:hypothetical protein
VVALAATNLVAVLAFGALYAAAGTRLLAQGPFLLGLALLFVGLTALWLAVERRQGHGLDPVRRLGRVAFGLVAVLLGAPVLVLLPLFGLETLLPPDVGPGVLPLAPVMTLLLIALALAVVVNLAGGLLLVGAAFATHLRPPRPPS